jgi:hypothetical protein
MSSKSRVKKFKKNYKPSLEEKIETIISYVLASKKLAYVHTGFTLKFPKWNTNTTKCQDVLKAAIAMHTDAINGLQLLDTEYIMEVPEADLETSHSTRLVDTDYKNIAQEIQDTIRSNTFAYTRYNNFMNIVNSITDTVIKLWIESNIDMSEFYTPNTEVCKTLEECGVQLQEDEIDYLMEKSIEFPQSLLTMWYAREQSVRTYYTTMWNHLQQIQKMLPYSVSISELAQKINSRQVKNFVLCQKYIDFITIMHTTKDDITIQVRRRDQWYKYVKSMLSKYSIKLNVGCTEKMTVFLQNLVNYVNNLEDLLNCQHLLYQQVQQFDASLQKVGSVNLQNKVASRIIDVLTSIPDLTDYIEKNGTTEPVIPIVQECKTFKQVQEYRINTVFANLKNKAELVSNPEKYFDWYMITDFLKKSIENMPMNATKEYVRNVLNPDPVSHEELAEIITFIALNKDFGKNTEHVGILRSLDSIPKSEYSFDLSGRTNKEILEIINNLGVNPINKDTYGLYTKICRLLANLYSQ